MTVKIYHEEANMMVSEEEAKEDEYAGIVMLMFTVAVKSDTSGWLPKKQSFGRCQ